MKKLLFALCLVPAFASLSVMAAPGKVKTLQPINSAKLDGLSIYGSFDFADSMDYSGSAGGQNISGQMNSEKAFGIGAKYMVGQLNNGIGLEVGGSFELGRSISSIKTGGQTIQNDPKPEVQFWTMYGQAAAFLTQEFGIYGGANYNIPQVKNANGADYKGKLGYQFGGTYLVSANLAIDGEYRTLNLSGSGKGQDNLGQEVSYNYDNIRNQGFMFRGRYMF